MKRLIAAVVLFVFVITIYLYGFFYIKNVCDEAGDLLALSVSYYKTSKNASEKVSELENYWTKKEKVLSIFSNHNAIDEIEMSIHLLAAHSSSKDDTMFLEYSGKIEKMLHQLMEDTIPSTHSIL